MPTDRRIARHCLRVTNRSELATFYTQLLGMHQYGSAYGYHPQQCLLQFRSGDCRPYRASQNDFYWKIGITLRDLDVAVAYLRQQAWTVSEPRQFRDIGYLCHLQDPQGFTIELLQQGFQGRAQPAGAGHPIGGQATLAHITLRVTDINAARDYCENILGMRLLSVQPVHEFGFCLYFYAWSDEPTPRPQLEAVENREWLWSRPYALLELQHLQQPAAVVRRPDLQAAGFDGFAYHSVDNDALHYLSLVDLEALS